MKQGDGMQKIDIILKKRGEGKSTEIIKQCAETNGYIICKDVSRACVIFNQAKEMNLTINYPITASEFKNDAYFSKNISGFYIDNIEEFFEKLTPVPVKAISATIWENT